MNGVLYAVESPRCDDLLRFSLSSKDLSLRSSDLCFFFKSLRTSISQLSDASILLPSFEVSTQAFVARQQALKNVPTKFEVTNVLEKSKNWHELCRGKCPQAQHVSIFLSLDLSPRALFSIHFCASRKLRAQTLLA